MNDQSLVPVFSGCLNNETVQLCDARLLHAALAVGRRFASWITDRIKEYGFIENQDFIAISQKREIGHGRGKTEYHLTLDMAKELAMVERSDIGRQVRRYFIECEKRAVAVNLPRQTRRSTTPLENLHLLVGHMIWLNAWHKHYAPALKLLNPKMALQIATRFQEADYTARAMARRYHLCVPDAKAISAYQWDIPAHQQSQMFTTAKRCY